MGPTLISTVCYLFFVIHAGGAFSTMSREDVELFCIDKQILVEVTATEEALIFDFESTTSIPHEHSV